MRKMIILSVTASLAITPAVAQTRPTGDDQQVATTCLGTLTYAVGQISDRDAAMKQDMNEASLAWYARVKQQTPDFMEFATKMTGAVEAASKTDGKSVGETSVWCMKNRP